MPLLGDGQWSAVPLTISSFWYFIRSFWHLSFLVAASPQAIMDDSHPIGAAPPFPSPPPLRDKDIQRKNFFAIFGVNIDYKSAVNWQVMDRLSWYTLYVHRNDHFDEKHRSKWSFRWRTVSSQQIQKSQPTTVRTSSQQVQVHSLTVSCISLGIIKTEVLHKQHSCERGMDLIISQVSFKVIALHAIIKSFSMHVYGTFREFILFQFFLTRSTVPFPAL